MVGKFVLRVDWLVSPLRQQVLYLVSWVLAFFEFTGLAQIFLNLVQVFLKQFVDFLVLFQVTLGDLQVVKDVLLVWRHRGFLWLLGLVASGWALYVVLSFKHLDLSRFLRLYRRHRRVSHGIKFFNFFQLKLLLPLLFCNCIQMLSVLVVDSVDFCRNWRVFRVPDWTPHLLQLNLIALRAYTLTVRVANKVLDQISVCVQLVLQNLSHAVSHFSHQLLQLLRLHHLGSPLHFVLSEFSREVTLLN